MVSIPSLWLPILLSGAAVFLVSSLIHMVLGYHANDMKKFPNEDAVADAVRKLNIPPGDYAYPKPDSMKDMGTPEFKEKQKKGPTFLMSVWPSGDPGMGTALTLWFIYSLIIGIFSAYVAGRALGPGADYLAVFRFAGVTAFAAYALGGWQASIWYKRPWAVTLKNTFDGLVYGLVTGGVFGWLWPR
jgi:Flp pilus assembly protein TadB